MFFERLDHACSLGFLASRALFLRWLGMVSLLIAELLAIGVLFEGEVLAYKRGAWARFMELLPNSVSACIAVAAALIVVARREVWTALTQAHHDFGQDRTWKTFVFAHLSAWAALVCVGKMLFDSGPGFSNASVWTLVWTGLAASTMSFWALAILPARGWKQFLWDCRHTIATAIPMGLMAWAAAMLAARLGWNFLSELTLDAVHFTMSFIYSNVLYQPGKAAIGTPSYQVAIAAGCAGYEGIGLISVFLIGYLVWARKQLRFPQALVLLPTGAVMIWLANVLRIVLLITIGSAGFPAIAHGGFHSQAGWLAFNIIALGLVVASGYLPWFAQSSTNQRDRGADATAAYLAPFLGTVAATMLTGSVSVDLDWLYGVRVLAAVVLLACFWPAYGKLRWSWSWQPVALGAAAFAAWLMLVPPEESVGPPQQLQSASMAWAGAWLAVRTFGYLVTAPLAEELAFRGFLMRRFVSPDFEQLPLNQSTWIGFAGSSVLFGLMHGHDWLPATAAGLLFAWAACRRGNLLDAVIAHGTTNALLAVSAVLTGNWRLWG